jgi:outer membrane immunogenic protein
MKKQFLFGASFIAAVPSMGLVNVASAADMALKAPVAPSYSWAGPYIGVSGGYGWGHSSQSDPGIPCSFFGTCGPTGPTGETFDGSYSMTGGVVGGGLGYNWQRGPAVFGIVGDYSWADISGSSNTCGASSPLPHSCGSDLQSLGTLRGLVGYAMGPNGNWLPYVTGGLAVGELQAWDALLPASGSDFRVGWTVGAGLAIGLTPNWIFQIEYLYVDLGDRQMFYVVPGVPETVSFTGSVIRVGIDYKFY